MFLWTTSEKIPTHLKLCAAISQVNVLIEREIPNKLQGILRKPETVHKSDQSSKRDITNLPRTATPLKATLQIALKNFFTRSKLYISAAKDPEWTSLLIRGAQAPLQKIKNVRCFKFV